MRVAASINPDQPTRGKCHVTVKRASSRVDGKNDHKRGGCS